MVLVAQVAAGSGPAAANPRPAHTPAATATSRTPSLRQQLTDQVRAATSNAAPAATADDPCPNSSKYDDLTYTSITCSFSYTGGTQTFVLPAGVAPTVSLKGAQGARGGTNGNEEDSANGGLGADRSFTLPAATADRTLTLTIGGQGNGTTGGYPDGGSGGTGQYGNGGGGGGSTSLQLAGHTTFDAIAAGGGGGGGNQHTVGGNSAVGGGGGAAEHDGGDGVETSRNNCGVTYDHYNGGGGKAGADTDTGGAAGEAGCRENDVPRRGHYGDPGRASRIASTDSRDGAGGDSESDNSVGAPGGGGGGGGGLFGGGGGGGAATYGSGGGGGGGASYVPTNLTNQVVGATLNSGNGAASISWTRAASSALQHATVTSDRKFGKVDIVRDGNDTQEQAYSQQAGGAVKFIATVPAAESTSVAGLAVTSLQFLDTTAHNAVAVTQNCSTAATFANGTATCTVNSLTQLTPAKPYAVRLTTGGTAAVLPSVSPAVDFVVLTRNYDLSNAKATFDKHMDGYDVWDLSVDIAADTTPGGVAPPPDGVVFFGFSQSPPSYTSSNKCRDIGAAGLTTIKCKVNFTPGQTYDVSPEYSISGTYTGPGITAASVKAPVSARTTSTTLAINTATKSDVGSTQTLTAKVAENEVPTSLVTSGTVDFYALSGDLAAGSAIPSSAKPFASSSVTSTGTATASWTTTVGKTYFVAKYKPSSGYYDSAGSVSPHGGTGSAATPSFTASAATTAVALTATNNKTKTTMTSDDKSGVLAGTSITFGGRATYNNGTSNVAIPGDKDAYYSLVTARTDPTFTCVYNQPCTKLGPGTYHVQVKYTSPDAALYASVTSSVFVVKVNSITASVEVTITPETMNGEPYAAVSATLDASDYTGTGTMTLYSGTGATTVLTDDECATTNDLKQGVASSACHVALTPGDTPSFSAKYKGDATLGDARVGSTTGAKVDPISSTVESIDVGSGSIEYGSSTTVTVTIGTGLTKFPYQGSVDFFAGGREIEGCKTVLATDTHSGGKSTAACPLPVLDQGTYAITAKTLGTTQATASAVSDAVSVTIDVQKPTLTFGTITPVGSTVTVPVTLSSTTSPTGGSITVTAKHDGSPDRTCTIDVEGTTTARSCSITLPFGAYSVSASYSGGKNFAPAGPADYGTTVSVSDPDAACSGGYATLWKGIEEKANGDDHVAVSKSLGDFASIDASVTAPHGACTIKQHLPFTVSGTTKLQDLEVSGVSGHFEQGANADGALMCLTAGRLSLPWGSTTSFDLSEKESVCLTLDGDATPDGVSGSVSTAGPLPLFAVPGAPTGKLTLDFSAKKSSAVTVSLGGTLSDGGSGVTAKLSAAKITYSKSDGLAFGGTVNVTGLTLPGSVAVPLSGTFTWQDSKLASEVQVGPLAATVSTNAVALTGLTGTLTDTALHLTGSVSVGSASVGSDKTTSADVDLSFASATDWSATVTSKSASSWKPLSNISISQAFTGSLCNFADAKGSVSSDNPCAEGGHKAGLSYRLVTGNATSPATTISAGGATVKLGTLTVSNDTNTCQDGTAPFVKATDSSLTIGDTAVTLSGCLALGGTGYVDLAAAAKSLPLGMGGSLQNLAATVSGAPGGLTVTGKGDVYVKAATSTAAKLGSASVQLANGVFALAGRFDLGPLGLSGTTGDVTYSNSTTGAVTLPDPVDSGKTVTAPAGLVISGNYTPTSSQIAAAKLVGITVATGTTLPFSVSVGADGATFAIAVTAPGSAPALTLPGGAITSAAITLAKSKTGTDFGVEIKGTAGSATLAATLVFSGGSWSGTGEVDNLTVFGHTIDAITGTVKVDSTGKATGSLSADLGKITLPGSSLTTTSLKVSIGTSGLSVAGGLTVTGRAVTFTGTLASLTVYSLTVSGSVTKWQPLGKDGLNLTAALTGTLSNSGSGTHISVTATGSPLASFTPLTGATALTVTLTGIGFGDGDAPAGCGFPAGDAWLTLSGTVDGSLGGKTASKSGTGCLDITAKTMSLKADLGFTLTAGNVTIDHPTLGVSYSSAGGFGASGSVDLEVGLPQNNSYAATLAIRYVTGGFVVGATGNFSDVLGKTSASAGLYYASVATPNFNAGVGTVDLKQGINIALSLRMPTALDYLTAQGVEGLPKGGASVAAVATFDTSNAAIVFSVAIDVGTKPSDLSDAAKASAKIASLKLQITVSPTIVSVALLTSIDITLASGKSASSNDAHFVFTGGMDVSDEEVQGFLTLNNIPGFLGFHIKTITLQIGIGAAPVPSIGLKATIDGWPPALYKVVGIRPDAVVDFTANLSVDQLLVSFSIDSATPGGVALEPLAIAGEDAATIIQVSHAQLYFSPDGATVGGTTYKPGFDLAFDGKIANVQLHFEFLVDPVNLQLSFHASVGRIAFGSLELGPVSVSIDAGLKTGLQVGFDASLSIGPGTVDTGPVTRLSGSVSAKVHFSLGSQGLSAALSGSLTAQGSEYDPITCFNDYGIAYTCGHHWVDLAPLSFSITNLSLDVTKSGIAIGIPNTTVTVQIPFPSSTASAGYRPLGRNGSLGRRVTTPSARMAPFRPSGPGAVKPANTAARRFQAVTVAPAATAARPTRTSTAARWDAAGDVPQGHLQPAIVTLPDHRVLLIGGADGRHATSTVAAFSPATRRWTNLAPMHVARTSPSAVVLADGRVLVTGGAGAAGPLASSEIYDPKGNTWRVTGRMHAARQFAVTARLTDGSVLVAGGRGAGGGPRRIDALATAERFDPASGSWRRVASMRTPRALADGVALPDGSVVVAGGYDEKHMPQTAERYIPAEDKWVAAGVIGHAEYLGSAVRLAASRYVLFVSATGQTSVFDPRDGSWHTEQPTQAAAALAPATTLGNGTVLLAGGFDVRGQPSTAAQTFSPATARWTVQTSMPTARFGAAVAPLADGTVLLAGGGGSTVAQTPSALVYVPGDGSAHPRSPAKTAARRNDAGLPGLAVAGFVTVGGVLVLLLAALLARRRRRVH